MTSRARTYIPVAILLLALVLRLIFLLQTKNLPFYYHPILDSGFFHHWANFKRQVAWLDHVSPFREPIYAYFVGIIYTLFRESLTIVRLAQCVLGGATALLLYSAARRTFGLFAGVVAGAVFALYGPAIFFACEINETALAMFLLAASAYFVTRAQDARPHLNSWLSGLLAGAAFLTRFTTIVVLPAWVLHLVLSKETGLRKATLVLIVGFLIPPIGYQASLLRADQRTILPLRSSWQAFLGSGATGGTVKLPNMEISVSGVDGAYRATAASDWIDGQRDFQRFARIEDASVASEVDAHRHWSGRVAEDFFSNPIRFIKTYFVKLGIFWGPSQPPANLDLRYVAGYSSLLRNPVLSFTVLSGLGLLGLAAGRRRKALYMALFVPGFSLFASFYLITDAEKMMLVPFLSIFAGFVGAAVAENLRRLRPAKATGYVVAAVILGLLLGQLPDHEMDEAANLVVTADVYREISIFEKAEASYKEAIARSPDLPDAYISMARLYASTGKPQMGIETLNQGLGRTGDPRLRIEKAELLLMADRPDEAISELREVENSYPYEPRLHQLLGRSLLIKGETEQAVEEIEKEVENVGGGFITFSVLGEAQFRLGEYAEAASNLEAALGFNPYNVATASLLADAYSKQGYHLKACEVIGRILSVDSGNMPLRHKLAVCLYKADRPRDALMHFKDLHKFDPANADIALNMGTVYAEMDSLDRAVEMWEQALLLDPDNQMARENLRTLREDLRGKGNE